MMLLFSVLMQPFELLPAWAQPDPDEISIAVDKNIVEPGMTALITGRVTGAQPGDKPLLSVFLPNGEPYWSNPVDVDEEGDYSYPLALGSMGANLVGSYRIVISYGSVEAETEVTLVPQLPTTCPNLEGDRILSSFKAGNRTYLLQYLLDNATLMAIDTDFERKSLVFHITTEGDGCIKLFLQSEIIEAENRNFTVTLDNQPGDFMEIEEDFVDDTRTLLINFTNGAKTIEITGTRVVPEFPHVFVGIFLIATISFTTIIARLLHRKALPP